MKIKIIFYGIMAGWTGTRTADFELPEGALVSDLIKKMKDRFENRLPEKLWDGESGLLIDTVQIMDSANVLKSRKSSLADGEEIIFFVMMSGG